MSSKADSEALIALLIAEETRRISADVAAMSDVDHALFMQSVYGTAEPTVADAIAAAAAIREGRWRK